MSYSFSTAPNSPIRSVGDTTSTIQLEPPQENKYTVQRRKKTSMPKQCDQLKQCSPSKWPLTFWRPSADILRRTFDFWTIMGGGGSKWKQIITAVRLSSAPRLIASSTNCLQHNFASLCSCNFLRAKSTAFWFEKTSHKPSLPIIKNSSSLFKVINLSSGSALNGPPGSPMVFIPSRCQSPSARVTPSCPFK